MNKKKLKLSVWQTLAIGYLIVILTGSVLLVLPPATAVGENTSYLGALFTSASATCVTGLTPYHTGGHWSLFGQIIILILIQLGGIGFMTFVTSILMLFRRGIGLGNRQLLMASAGSGKLAGLPTLVKRIVIGSAVFEILGASILCFRFVPDFGWGKGIFYAVFHSVSAFCNAGFDLMPTEGGGSLSLYAHDPIVSVTVCILIIVGGLGFCVWSDVVDCRLKFKKFQLNTKIVLTVTAILIAVATALFMLFEWNQPYYRDYNFGQKLLLAFFDAVTPRTAGFYTTAPQSMSDSSYLLTIVLMFIGGSSGSTAGGLKVGTFSVIIMGMVGVFRGKRDLNIAKKRVEYSLVYQSLAIFAALLMIITASTIAICAIDSTAGSQETLYECVSAVCTVGLSMGITAKLSAASQVILILLMYAGRVGILTLALALAKRRKNPEIRYPVDSFLIG